ncbi:hypothetical protein O181_025653 [Austropuccinia psidii MF-1]|uniref:Uncharacterized protein n=1 Tax=Austropuccinia psidii MF-1 TaxID=1389203 RepID=A0A9Q3CN92_9BASI|nr:hypothetical protein [Austropuccinia psidii MF-1]
MVPTINGRNKTGTRSGRPSSKNSHLEDSRVATNFPRSVPTAFDINSGPELIKGNFLRVEPLPSGSHRNISVPVTNLVQKSQRERVQNIPKHFEGGYELLLTHQELSGSSEDHRALRRMNPIFLQGQEQKKELEMTPAYEKEGPVASTSSKPAPELPKDKQKGPQKKNKCLRNNQGKGKGKAN